MSMILVWSIIYFSRTSMVCFMGPSMPTLYKDLWQLSSASTTFLRYVKTWEWNLLSLKTHPRAHEQYFLKSLGKISTSGMQIKWLLTQQRPLSLLWENFFADLFSIITTHNSTKLTCSIWVPFKKLIVNF